MTDASKFQFTNPSVPKAYEEFFVPRLFEPWAALLLDEAKLKKGQAIIDVATGPGTVARLAAPRLGPKGRIVATDISRPMLDIARAKRALADLIPAPFSWPSSAELKAATEEAGFRKVHLLTRSLPMVMEKGLEQAVQSFSATPVSPGVAALPQSTQDSFFARMRQELSALVVDGKVIGEMVSNIIVAHAEVN